MGVSQWLDGLFHGQSIYKWMITRGTLTIRKAPNELTHLYPVDW